MPVLDAEKTVLESITAMYDVCFQAEKKVADFILVNPGLAVNANVSELANYSGVSDATVVRFCKHLGYEGYYQMRLLLARDIGRRTVITDMVSQDETSVRGLFKSIAESALAAASATEATWKPRISSGNAPWFIWLPPATPPACVRIWARGWNVPVSAAPTAPWLSTI